MYDKLLFAASHYFALLVFLLACWGFGSALLIRALRADRIDPWLGHLLRVCAGMGVSICLLQALGIAGLLRPLWLYAVLSSGWALALWGLLRQMRGPVPQAAAQDSSAASPGASWAHAFVLIGIALTAIGPLRPPHVWDELAYHLPHAREWAESGSITINSWLRYPWFPFNFHLLFAAALALYDDIVPHLLHATSGWLVALIIYRIGMRELGAWGACLAALIWLHVTRGEYLNAYIDMAVTLFLLAAFVSYLLWRDNPQRRLWLALSAFMLGLAIGSKYQALIFLPLAAAALVWHNRRARTWLIAVGALLLPCGYWYVRNLLATGDPFNPLGGPVFGFFDWNQGDLNYQLADATIWNRGWPSAFFIGAALAPLMKSTWARSWQRAILIAAAYGFGTWLVTSHYPRYLMPAYPVLALLAAKGYVSIARGLRDRLAAQGLWWSPARLGLWKWVLFAAPALLTLGVAWRAIEFNWARVAANAAQRSHVLHGELSAHMPVIEFLATLPASGIYQVGLEGVLYYAPRPVRGDHFGPWRYRDFASLPPAQLARKLREQGLTFLVVDLRNNESLLRHPEFSKQFRTLFTNSQFGVFSFADAPSP